MDSRGQNIDQDFKALEKSSEVLHQQLRIDEGTPDLLDQLSQRPDPGTGSHRYYVEPYQRLRGSLVERNEFIPFPPEVTQQYRNVESASFMGILPEINRVWITVDNVLYLWNYHRPEQPYVYDGINEVIVSVAISAPKPGIFLESVRYLLIVATPIDISVLAICSDENYETIRLSPTSYTLPSDNVTMMKIVGTQSGRIFMAGSDSNIYELEYSLSENSWAGVFGGEAVRKCRKVNHFAWNWKLEHVVPPLFRTFVAEEDTFADLVFDNSRNILYGVTLRGVLNGFYLGVNGSQMNFFLNGFNIFAETKSYLNSSPYAPDDLRRSFSGDNLSAQGFSVLNVFPLSPLESRKVHAVVVLTNGTRIYLSLQGSRYGSYESSFDVIQGPTSLRVVGVRSPPSTDVILHAKGQVGHSAEQGYLPTFDPSRKLNVSTAFYARGVSFMAMERAQQPDELLSIYEDFMLRGSLTSSTPCLREGVSVDNFTLAGRGFNGKVFDVKELTPAMADPTFSQLLALNLHSATPPESSIQEKTHHRVTGLDFNDSTATNKGSNSWLGLGGEAKSVAQPPFATLMPMDSLLSTAARSKAAGLELSNLDNIAVLTEMSQQHLPASKYFTKRHFAVLVNDGIHIFSKLRPADLVLDSLSHIDRGGERSFGNLFAYYGERQCIPMCLGLLVGLPADAGLNPYADTVFNSRNLVLDDQVAAMLLEVLVGSTTKATFRNTLAPIHAAAMEADSRIVAARAASDFVRSAMHDAMYLLASRLLRPIWLRVVVENGSLSPVWTVELVDEIKRPLLALRELIFAKYSTIIVNDIKQTASRYPPQTPQQLQQLTVAQNERQLAAQAKAFDDESIRNLYMLLSRSCHLLSLIQVMRSVETTGHIAFSSAALNGCTFRAIVVLPKVQEQTKRSLHELINALVHSDRVHLAREATDILSSECYHYFSRGDRYSYEAAKALEDLRKLRASSTEGQSSASPRVMELLSTCVRSYIQASAFWNSPEYVLGEHSELSSACAALVDLGDLGRDAVVEVCLTAAENFRPATVTTAATGSRGHTQSAGGNGNAPWDANRYHGGSVTTEAMRTQCFDACYRCLVDVIATYGSNRIILGAGIVDLGNTAAGSSSSSAASPEVVAQQVQRMITAAVTKSQDPVFHQLLYTRLLDSRADALLPINSPFIEDFLLQHNPSLLYQYFITGAEGRTPKYLEAARLMRSLAEDNQVDRAIEERVQCLKRAIVSAQEATQRVANGGFMNNNGRSSGFYSSSAGAATTTARVGTVAFREEESLVSELRDVLEIAENYQVEIRDKLQADFDRYDFAHQRHHFSEDEQQKLEVMESAVQRLSQRLCDINELFRLCEDYFIWDYSLQLLYVSRTNDVPRIERLWRSFLYRLVPYPQEGIDSDVVVGLLQEKRAEAFVDVDVRNQCNVAFSDVSAWLPALGREVVALGQRLQAAQNPVHFPLAVLVDELEDILSAVHLTQQPQQSLAQQQLLASSSSSSSMQLQPYTAVAGVTGASGLAPSHLHWVVQHILRPLQLPYDVLAETYFQVYQNKEDTKPARTFLIAVQAGLLLDWIRAYTRMDSTSSALNATDDDVQYCWHMVRSRQMEVWQQTLLRHLGSGSLRKSYPVPALEHAAKAAETLLQQLAHELRRLDMVTSAERQR